MTFIKRILFMAVALSCATLMDAQSRGIQSITQSFPIKLEAESATYYKCEVASDAKYSKGKALRMTDEGASIRFTVQIDQRDKYRIAVAGDGIGGEKQVNCEINGNSCSFKVNQYGEVEIGAFMLNQGSNNIVITPSWTWYHIDYISILGKADNLNFDLSPSPVDAQATPAAQKLYQYLYEHFGENTISGMMLGDMSSYNGDVTQHDDLKAVYQASGKYPLLVGVDMMNATGKSENYSYNIDYTRRMVSAAKDIYRRGGIPAFTWHWRDPSRSTDAFYTADSQVGVSAALNRDGSWNTSSQLYRYLIQDIDAIADHFLELQDEGMACIFRPLHESSGKWFWWGREGAQNFQKLYHLLYHEMVDVKGVHNVIWVWNAGADDQDWDPGSEYYDVVSADIYNPAFDYQSCYPTFDQLKQLTRGKKIIALSENGPIPDMDKEVEDRAVWSWWMPWYETWNGGYVKQTSNEQWRKTMNDSRILTLGDNSTTWGNPATGIELTKETTSPSLNKMYFDLSGRSVSLSKTSLRKGIYITQDGKKIVK